MTHAARLIRSTVIWWQNRRARKAMHRAIPVLRELQHKAAECRRHHRKGVAQCEREMRRLVLKALSRPVQSGGR